MNFVFASGFLVPQHLLGINYFRGLEAHLAGQHADSVSGGAAVRDECRAGPRAR